MGPNRVWSPGDILSPYRKLAGPGQQLSHVNQQADTVRMVTALRWPQERMQTVGEAISAVLVTGPMSTPVRLLTELIEQAEDESANVEKDRAGSPQPGRWRGGE